MARSMLLEGRVPRCLDLYGCLMAVQRHNVLPSAVLDWKSPEEVLLGIKPRSVGALAGFLEPFAKVYFYDKVNRVPGKSEPKAQSGIYLGNGQCEVPGHLGGNSFLVFCIGDFRMYRVGDVTPVGGRPFVDMAREAPLVGRRVAKDFAGGTVRGTVVSWSLPYYYVYYDDGDAEELERGEVDPILLGGLAEKTLSVGAVQVQQQCGSAAVRQGCEEDARLGEGPDLLLIGAAVLAESPGPGPSLAEALRGPDAAAWRAVVQKEFDSLDRNQSFEFAEMPPGARALPGKVVLVVKPGGARKGRFVVMGNRDTTEYSLTDTYAPVGS